MAEPRRACVALCCLLAACASSRVRESVRPPDTSAARPQAPVEPDPLTDAESSQLQTLAARLVGVTPEARRAAAELGLALVAGDGALGLTGERAQDDHVREAAVVQRVGATAALLVTTACGDAWLVATTWRDGAWRATDRQGLVTDARPGACRLTRARAEARAMRSRGAREVVAVFSSGSEDGDEVRDPVLRLYHLSPDGKLEPWSEDVPFGGTDDATGAVREAEWVVDEALDLPRDLYVQINPGARGPGGAAPQVVVRRTYRLQGARLVLTEETTEAYRPRGRAAATAPWTP